MELLTHRLKRLSESIKSNEQNLRKRLNILYTISHGISRNEDFKVNSNNLKNPNNSNDSNENDEKQGDSDNFDTLLDDNELSMDAMHHSIRKLRADRKQIQVYRQALQAFQQV